MPQKLNLLIRRNRLLVLIAGLLLLVCVVGTAAVGFFLWNKGQEVTKTPTMGINHFREVRRGTARLN